MSSDELSALARRLFSCPACGAKWVGNVSSAGADISGVRSARPTDPPGAAVVCDRCGAAIKDDGTPVFDALRRLESSA
jgi:hypothetical protein